MKSNSKPRLLSVITAASSATVVCYYFVYLMLCLVGFDSRLMCFFALFVMAVAALPVLFRAKLQRLLGRAFTPLQIIFTVLLIVYIISVIFFWCYICIDSGNTPEAITERYAEVNNTGENTVIMVFGCRAYDMRPSLTLRLRLDAAYKLLVDLPDALCIVSGGQGNNETYAEAIVMKNYLTERGINEERIILESNAHSTSENVRFTKELAAEYGISDKEFIGVSTSFHLPRIELLSKRYDFPMSVCSSPSPSFGHFYVSMIREYLSYIKMTFFDRAVIITRVT